jgi:4-coumarate--CoA ligase
MFLVPPLVLFMARSPSIKAEDLQKVKFAGNGAAPLSDAILKEFVGKANNPDIYFRNGEAKIN